MSEINIDNVVITDHDNNSIEYTVNGNRVFAENAYEFVPLSNGEIHINFLRDGKVLTYIEIPENTWDEQHVAEFTALMLETNK